MIPAPLFILIVTMLEPLRSLGIKGDREILYVPPASRQLTRNAPVQLLFLRSC